MLTNVEVCLVSFHDSNENISKLPSVYVNNDLICVVNVINYQNYTLKLYLGMTLILYHYILTFD
jgi:hypothetical protein